MSKPRRRRRKSERLPTRSVGARGREAFFIVLPVRNVAHFCLFPSDCRRATLRSALWGSGSTETPRVREWSKRGIGGR